MKRLIVNADDFGLHPAVNHGIIEGYEKGWYRRGCGFRSDSRRDRLYAAVRACG